MDTLANALGALGSCLTVIIVLAVAVETILEPLTLFKGLRKKIDPAELVGDLKEWVPGDSEAERKIEDLAKFNAKNKVAIAEMRKILQEAAVAAENAADLFGQDTDEIKRQLRAALSKYEYGLTEKKRITILRGLAAIIGMAIAWVLKINCIEMISGLLPAVAVETLSTPAAQTGGVLLTGLAASAGSSFWHDMLAKIRAAKTLASAK